MSTTLNWGRLVEQDRAKNVGVPWNNEESKALSIGIPATYVRLGILTLEDYEARKKEESKMKETPLIIRDKEEVLMIAHQKGIAVTSDASKETIIQLIEQQDIKKKPRIEPEKESIKKVKKGGKK